MEEADLAAEDFEDDFRGCLVGKGLEVWESWQEGRSSGVWSIGSLFTNTANGVVTGVATDAKIGVGMGLERGVGREVDRGEASIIPVEDETVDKGGDNGVDVGLKGDHWLINPGSTIGLTAH